MKKIQCTTSLYQLKGFTIVELLVVIVVIGVLASITVVSYTGVTSKAAVTSVKSDASNISRQLKLFQAIHGFYPESFDIDNCPATPISDTDYCLKLSNDNSLANYVSNNEIQPQIFSLVISNSNGASIRTTDSIGLDEVNQIYVSCLDIQDSGASTGDGIYWITPDSGSEMDVYCDMTNDGGGWTKIYEGLATSSTSVSRTFGDVVEISGGIVFNNMKVQAKNWDFSEIATTTEPAKLDHTFSWYFEWLHDEPDTPNPYIKFHDIDGAQDVQFTNLNIILFGYGNTWRRLAGSQYYLTDNTSTMYLGSVTSAIHTDDWGHGDYNNNMNDSFPEESGLGLTSIGFQEIYVWVK